MFCGRRCTRRQAPGVSGGRRRSRPWPGCEARTARRSPDRPRTGVRPRSAPAAADAGDPGPRQNSSKERHMPDVKLIGENYTPPDLIAKVTGRARYAEDYRIDGMLFAKLLLSPMPHARVRRVDTRAAQAIYVVKAVLTAADLPDLSGAEAGLINEPRYQGASILYVAAVEEFTAHGA